MAGPLRDVPLDGGPVAIRGVLGLERTAAGLLPLRLPQWTRKQSPDPFLDGVALMPSGVRLAFRTTATVLELRLLTTVRRTGDDRLPPAGGSVDLVVDGEVAGRADAPLGNALSAGGPTTGGRLEPGEPGTVRFAGLDARDKDVELWLPQQTPCELVGLRADAAVTRCPPHGRRGWVHHGSSISHCAEADRPTGTWPAVAARAAGVELTNLSLAGNAMLDPFVARVVRDHPADLISLKLGINVVNAAAFRLRSFAPAVHGFLDTVRDGHPRLPLLVISPIACPAVEDAPGPTGAGPDGRIRALGDPADVAAGALTLAVIRDELARVVRERSADDPHLHHLDGRALLGPDEAGALSDGLHPDAPAYRRMGRRFAAAAFGPNGPFAP